MADCVDFAETFRTLKRCPECGSSRLEWDVDDDGSTSVDCLDCGASAGWSGTFFP